MEKIVESKICDCWKYFDITDKDMEFYDRVSPIFWWIKYQIPVPKKCPECREKRRLAFRNERFMYKRNSDFSWKSIISMYSPDKKYKVYSQDEWWSDDWNAFDYWREFDFSRIFFEQINELILEVPIIWLANSETENSTFNNYVKWIKNCYMSSVIYMWSEDVYYSSWVYTWKNIIDWRSIFDSEVCYELHDCRYCYNCFYVAHCLNSNHCYFSRNLTGCKNCIFCANLENKEYYIYNKSVSKDEFEAKKSELLSWSYKKILEAKEEFTTFSLSKPFVFANLINCEDSTWDNLFDSKNSHMCFDLVDIEDSKYCNSWKTKDSYDWLGWENERCYEFSRVWWSKNVLFTFDWVQSNNTILCFSVYNSSNLFWCVWLKWAEYCIFNKQYSKEKYEELVPKIIEHMNKTWEWWEFFPLSMSPFWYNETAAMEFYPLSKNQALEIWINWSDFDNPKPDVSKIIPASKLPDNIKDVPNDIINWAIECEITHKPFRIIKQELDFYRKYNIPIPRISPNERHFARMNSRNPRKLFDRKCDKCWVPIKTNFNPSRKEIIYCEDCYSKEIN